VVHLAAVAGVSNYVREPATTLVNNLIGTYNVLEAIKKRKHVQRFLNFSTSEVYGPEAVGVDETCKTKQGPIGEARWSYAVSKTAAEHLCFAYHREYGVPTVSVRPFNIYGPYQVGEGAIHDISLRALRDQTVTVTGDGQQVRTWCYIDDMVQASLLLLSRPEAIGKVFNVGNAAPVVKMIDLANLIIEAAGASSKVVFEPHIEVDVRLRSPNVDRVRDELGFTPEVSLEQGLDRTISWYRQHQDELIRRK
jgi:nucleoside-diphosphate-sugar epimerase